MSLETATGILFIMSAVWFNVWFAVLAKQFDYPDILRRPTEEILERFRAGGSSLILTGGRSWRRAASSSCRS